MNYVQITLDVPRVRETDGADVTCAGDIRAACADMASMAQEAFVVLTLDQKHRIISRRMVSLGTLTEAMAHPRDVFRGAIEDNAAAVALVHNHPSGDPEPSRADRLLTQRMKEAGAILGIRVLDHVIIGREKYYSFAESGAI